MPYFQAPGLFAGPIVPQPAGCFPGGHHPPHECGCEERPHYHEFCPSCCQPAHACCCSPRRCRKEAKELLVEGKAVAGDQAGKLAVADLAVAQHVLGTVRLMNGAALAGDQGTAANTNARVTGAAKLESASLTAATINTAGVQGAFIGGGCCVHLSIEYMPDNPMAPAVGAVAVMVADSDKTVMMWAKVVDATDGYQIQEDIITTHPGAKLTAVVVNVTARVRWCETFSC